MKPVGERKLIDLKGRNIVVYDLEIKNSIDMKNVGWQDHHKMGISVGAAFDYRDYRFRIFLDDNMPELVDRLNEPNTLVVAFNQKGFDNKVLRRDETLLENLSLREKLALREDENLNLYDMLVESRKGARVGMVKGFKLADHLEAMGLPSKTDDGANAPLMWQEGRLGELIDYGLNDVRVEQALFNKVYLNPQMACAYQPVYYSVRDPAELIDWN